jgi:hypothetical protein
MTTPVTFEGGYQGRSYFFDIYPEKRDWAFGHYCHIFRKLKNGQRGLQLQSARNWEIFNANRHLYEERG